MHNRICSFELKHTVCVLDDYGTEGGLNSAEASRAVAPVQDRNQARTSHETHKKPNHDIWPCAPAALEASACLRYLRPATIEISPVGRDKAASTNVTANNADIDVAQ